MHEYLDEDISEQHEQVLKAHLKECEQCQAHFHELEKTIALVKSLSLIEAPSDFTNKVMKKLPKEKKKISIQRWFIQHPLLTAASLFVIFMMGSFISTWNEQGEFSVTKQSNLIVNNDTVIVPEGEVIKGDIVVRNGTIQIEGQVEGNVIVINGEKYMSSAGQVTGEIKEINALFEWIWYQIKHSLKEAVYLFNQDTENVHEQSQEVAVFSFSACNDICEK